MKKLLPLLLGGAVLLAICGCAYGAATSQQGTPYDLFFVEADLSAVPGGDALRAETV